MLVYLGGMTTQRRSTSSILGKFSCFIAGSYLRPAISIQRYIIKWFWLRTGVFQGSCHPVPKVVNGKTKNKLDKIFLNEREIINMPEEGRLIIRLEAMDREYLLFHEKLVKILLEQNAKGVLFVPLHMFGPGIRWWLDNTEEINKLHPW